MWSAGLICNKKEKIFVKNLSFMLFNFCKVEILDYCILQITNQYSISVFRPKYNDKTTGAKSSSQKNSDCF